LNCTGWVPDLATIYTRTHVAQSISLDARVQPHVPRQHVAAPKRLWAHRARMRLHRLQLSATCCQLIGRQQVATGWTTPMPSRHVLGQPVARRKRLAAFGAQTLLLLLLIGHQPTPMVDDQRRIGDDGNDGQFEMTGRAANKPNAEGRWWCRR